MNKIVIGIGAAIVLACVMTLSGCFKGDTPEDKTANIAKTIKIGTSSATAVGLVAVPNAEEASKVAREALRVLNENVFPILEGDEKGLTDGLARLRDLSVFTSDDEEKDKLLEKFRLVLETALPLLESNLPDDLADKAVDQLPNDAKAYIVAFFSGMREGIEAYLGDDDTPRGSDKYNALREALAK